MTVETRSGRPRKGDSPLYRVLARHGYQDRAAVEFLLQSCFLKERMAYAMLAGDAPVRAIDAVRLGVLLSPVEVRDLCRAQGAEGLAELIHHASGPTEAEGAFYDEGGPAELA